jgi:hypothetical protein
VADGSPGIDQARRPANDAVGPVMANELLTKQVRLTSRLGSLRQKRPVVAPQP